MPANFKAGGFNDGLPAWHKLGLLPEYAYQWKSVTEGFNAAQMMYNLSLTPCQTTIGDRVYDLEGRRMVVREPSLGDDDYTPLDVVGDGYVLIQNSEVAEWFDPLCQDYQLATFGVLDEGKIVWLAFETDEFDIQGDPFKGYLMVFSKTAGGGSFGVGYTNVRIVCMNTFMQAESEALDLMKFSHKGQVKDLVKMRAWAEHLVASSRKDVIASWNLLVQAKFDELKTAQVIEAAVPEKGKHKAIKLADVAPGLLKEDYAKTLVEAAQKQADKEHDTVMNTRLAIAHRLNVFNEEFPQFAGTGYAVVNAVTQEADWPERYQSNTPRASLLGYRSGWKTRAWATALELAQKE